jgi:KaiC/GvpD/RAD55 family RecA-like ATPase
MKDFMKVSPLKILEKSSRRALGRGNLGVLMARAGVGKTACLIHIAFDKLFRKEKLVHVSLEDIPEKITSYYNVIFYDLVKALNMDDEHEIRMLFERNRMILAYLQQSFEVGRLRENLKNLVDKIDFVPDTLIVDGLDFEEADRELIEGLKEIASQFNVEIWFSALTHRHISSFSCSPANQAYP